MQANVNRKGEIPLPRINVIEKFCKSCGLCIEVCPKKIIAIGDTANDKGFFTAVCINQDECIGCGLCATICPDVAIEVYK